VGDDHYLVERSKISQQIQLPTRVKVHRWFVKKYDLTGFANHGA
jgi:hypothetical protein